MKELGYHVFTIDLVGHPFNYDNCDLEYFISKKNKYYRYFILNSVFLYCLIKFDIFLFSVNGESLFVSPLFENWEISQMNQRIELKIYKLLGKKVIFEIGKQSFQNEVFLLLFLRSRFYFSNSYS